MGLDGLSVIDRAAAEDARMRAQAELDHRVLSARQEMKQNARGIAGGLNVAAGGAVVGSVDADADFDEFAHLDLDTQVQLKASADNLGIDVGKLRFLQDAGAPVNNTNGSNGTNGTAV